MGQQLTFCNPYNRTALLEKENDKLPCGHLV